MNKFFVFPCFIFYGIGTEKSSSSAFIVISYWVICWPFWFKSQPHTTSSVKFPLHSSTSPCTLLPFWSETTSGFTLLSIVSTSSIFAVALLSLLGHTVLGHFSEWCLSWLGVCAIGWLYSLLFHALMMQSVFWRVETMIHSLLHLPLTDLCHWNWML